MDKGFIKASICILLSLLISVTFIFITTLEDDENIGKHYTLDKYTPLTFTGAVVSIENYNKDSYNVTIEVKNTGENVSHINELSLVQNLYNGGQVKVSFSQVEDVIFGIKPNETVRYSAIIPKGLNINNSDYGVTMWRFVVEHRDYALKISENRLLFPKGNGISPLDIDMDKINKLLTGE